MQKKDVKINSDMFNNNSKLGSGVEGSVYKVSNDIYKLFHSAQHSNITEEFCLYLTTIKTKQIRMPEAILYNEQNEFCGYTTFYLNKGKQFHFEYMKVNDFFDNLNILYQDINLLSQKHVKLDDINLFITNDFKIYVTDVGNYQFLPDKNIESIKKTNEILLNDSIIDLFQNCFNGTLVKPAAISFFQDISLLREDFVREMKTILEYYPDINSFISDLYEELTEEEKIIK